MVSGHRYSEPAAKPARKPGWKERILKSSLLSSAGVAILIHVIIAMAIGSYVVFEGIVPAPFFQSPPSSEFVELTQEEMPSILEEELPDMNAEEVDTVESASAAEESGPDLADIITVADSGLTPSFTMPPTPGTEGMLAGNLMGGVKGEGTGTGKIKLGSLFGSSGLTGQGAFTGYLYDLKQNREEERTELGVAFQNNAPFDVRDQRYRATLSEFLGRWDATVLNDFFRSDDPLATTQIFMPRSYASEAPKAFDVERKVQPSGWMLFYQGEISPPFSGTFRLVGHADDVMVVRVDGDIVLDASWVSAIRDQQQINTHLYPFYCDLPPDNPVQQYLHAGKWMKLKAGKKYPIEILLGEIPGGHFSAVLMVEEENGNYELNPRGYPVLPVFQLTATELPDYKPGETGPVVLDDGLIFGAN